MPAVVFVLALGVFGLTTSEYMVSGLIPSLTSEFGVSVSEIGYLVSAYAGAMVIGGPLLTAALVRFPRRTAILSLTGVFVAGSVFAALAPSYGALFVARLVTGVAASAFIGVALTICAELVGRERQGRASSVVLGGLMVGTVIGLPAATYLGDAAGWRYSFWAIALVALAVGVGAAVLLPAMRPTIATRLSDSLAEFRNPKLWAVFTTSLLLIGSAFAGFTYFVPLLTDESGFGVGVVPLLLSMYGLAALIGTAIVGRYADRFTIPVLAVGSVGLTVGLLLFALLAQSPAVAVVAMLLIGFFGVSMNPAMVTRGMLVSSGGPLVNSVHTAFVMLGVVVGSWIGGVAISAGGGLRAPLWIGVGLAVVALLTLVPDLRTTLRSGSKATSRSEKVAATAS